MQVSFGALLKKYLEDDLDPAELRIFLDMAAEKANQQKLLDALDQALAESNVVSRSDEREIEKMFQLMLIRAASQEKAEKTGTVETAQQQTRVVDMPRKRNRMLFLRTAAVVIPLAGLSVFLWLMHTGNTLPANTATEQAVIHDVEPGGDKAVLTLADGSKIVLDAASDGTLAHQTGVEVVKLAGGQLAYRAVGGTGNEVVYNTMNTPRGGQYQLVLPDGSRIWLNASSSLTFPVAFTGKERRVSLQGEGYFEVTPNRNMPFTVEVNGTEINVLGTHFNVNAYTDEDGITTTLLEGKVRVSTGNTSELLKPGQQAQLNRRGEIEVLPTPNPEEVVAWKNGLFFFKGADLPSIMRQLARWYDLEVAYENGSFSKRRFSGQVYRNLKLSEVLKVLELSDVHFRVEDRKVTVIP